MSTLTIKSYHVSNVLKADCFSMDKNTQGFYDLSIDFSFVKKMEESSNLIDSFDLSVVNPGEWDIYVSSIMDIIPISTKVLGSIGNGITHTLTGVYVVLCGEDIAGNQICAFGNSNGILSEQLVPNKCGTPSDKDIIILLQAKLKENEGFSRPGPDAINNACDLFCDEIRAQLKNCNINEYNDKHIYKEVERPNKPKVAIVKLVSGQGAMYDTHYLADEPSAFINSKSIIDSAGTPIIITPNEYRDGAIKAMY